MKKYMLIFAALALLIACQSTSSKKDSQVMPSHTDMALIDTAGLKNFKVLSNEWINDSTGVIHSLTYQYTTDAGNDTVVTVMLPEVGEWVNR